VSEYTTVSTNLQENLRLAQSLVRTIAEQNAAVEAAYRRGWTECGKSLSYVAAEAWEAGYDAAGADRIAEWEQLQKQIHKLGAHNYRTFEERRAEELERLKPRPGDFRGAEQDPGYIERCRASMESIVGARSRRHRAAA